MATSKYGMVESEIKEIYHSNKGRYGYRRITLEMRNRGHVINHKTVSRLMRLLGIKSLVRGKKYVSYKGTTGVASPNILKQNFKAERPLMKWATDVTEFRVMNKKVYLSPVMELYNGEIINYTISSSPNFGLVKGMLEGAVRKIRGKDRPILHSDQGWHYRMKEFRQILVENGITQSMSRKGNCYDNAVMENFFGTIKSEMFYMKKYTSVEELEKEIKEYIDYYNNDRIRLNLNGMSPVKYRIKEKY
ncbi:IS3 family transposase [Pedobacter changchengzhani]|uniref:IS3 family transposase n=1 Tax=Pedobacter changchengzhani TaxID=2529274 RepID=A0A4R5MJC2_9SPHI|nr:IS3 family transposase [Pedobacter changchengzhani]